jgi:hypothetical protein
VKTGAEAGQELSTVRSTCIAGTAGIVAQEPVSRKVGGWPAMQVDLTVDSSCPASAPVFTWPSPGGASFLLDDGLRVRVVVIRAVLERSIGLIPLVASVVVVAEAGPDANLDLLLQKADELLGTMKISL